MGNQQLIILVIGVVIVGIATVVGIDAFEDNRVKANADAIAQDLAKMGADAQAWKQKPTPFGGQGLSCTTATPPVCTEYADDDFTNLDDLSKLGYETGTTGVFENLNGFYSITGAGSGAGVIITGCNGKTGVHMSLTVNGLTSNDFSSVQNIGTKTADKTCTPATQT